MLDYGRNSGGVYPILLIIERPTVAAFGPTAALGGFYFFVIWGISQRFPDMVDR